MAVRIKFSRSFFAGGRETTIEEEAVDILWFNEFLYKGRVG